MTAMSTRKDAYQGTPGEPIPRFGRSQGASPETAFPLVASQRGAPKQALPATYCAPRDDTPRDSQCAANERQATRSIVLGAQTSGTARD